jgi:hypothetical protein
MRSFTFTYLEVSMFGSFERRLTVQAKTDKSAWRKLSQIQGNRDFQQIQLVEVRA